MARFYGSMQGSRGEATRCGTPGSGMLSHVRGWDFGVRVEAYDAQGSDRFRVWLTRGSNAPQCRILLGDFSQADYETLLIERGGE